MGTLYLVRHGQASFGADNYDQLSPLGRQQAVRLGEYWRSSGQRFDAVLLGTLRRHTQTLEGIAEGLPGLPPAIALPGLNEYDSLALIRAIHNEPLQKPDTPELYRHHFRLLRDGLAAYAACSTRCATTTQATTCCWSAAAAPSPPPWARCWAPHPR